MESNELLMTPEELAECQQTLSSQLVSGHESTAAIVTLAVEK